jgi:hypothetical protein
MGARRRGGQDATGREATPPAATGSVDVADLRARIVRDFAAKLDKYLPESGDLRPWKLAEIEAALSTDMQAVSRAVIESRIEADPVRVPAERPVCPRCGRPVRSVDLDRSAHRVTIFGKVHYTRAYAPCHACGVAFSPSGHCVGLRQGLL